MLQDSRQAAEGRAGAGTTRSLVVLGSTGSIGRQTLEIVRRAGGRYRVEGLGARSSWEELAAQAAELRPRFVALADAAAAERLAGALPPGTELLAGPGALEELCRVARYDVALNGVVGAAGLRSSLAVLERGRTLALANKESLVMAGRHLMALAAERGAALVPVDSEHCAILQCLRGEDLGRVRRVILTASGGPFRTLAAAGMASVTPAEALRHPNWSMGPRITVGSATLMNKALEIVEVHHLFGLERERIEVVIHPQSIVHSLVEFVDGSVIAQLGPPDMRLPIHYALNHPAREPLPFPGLRGFDLELFRRLDFEKPDVARFPALGLGWRCVEEGSDSGSVLNAADEIAVDAFLRSEIAFPDICRVNEAVLGRRPGFDASVDELLRADALARELARAEIRQLAAAG
jgi:1-deoxy-D-xylulose-5-phosphate reductoisomerase